MGGEEHGGHESTLVHEKIWEKIVNVCCTQQMPVPFDLSTVTQDMAKLKIFGVC